MPDRMGKKEVGVLRRQPVITRIDSFKGTSMCCVWALRHHTGAQYSAGATASAKQEVLLTDWKLRTRGDIPKLVGVADDLPKSSPPEQDFALHSDLQNWFGIYRSVSINRNVGVLQCFLKKDFCRDYCFGNQYFGRWPQILSTSTVSVCWKQMFLVSYKSWVA